MELDAIQAALQQAQLDGWLFYDHHHRDPIAYRILGLSEAAHLAALVLLRARGRRAAQAGASHRAARLDSLPGRAQLYQLLAGTRGRLAAMLNGAERIAMQYSPHNAIMYVSMVDAGTIEVLRGIGKHDRQLRRPCQPLRGRPDAGAGEEPLRSAGQARCNPRGWLSRNWPPRRSAAGTNEYEMVQWFQRAMADAGLVWEHGPNVSVNANSSDWHYEPTEQAHAPIRHGDFLLIDIWAAEPRSRPHLLRHHLDRRRRSRATEQRAAIFDTVRNARDAAIENVKQAFAADKPIAGWEADDAARAVIREAGYGEYLHPSHRPQHRHGDTRQRRTPRQSRNTRRAPTSCPIPASPSSPEFT